MVIPIITIYHYQLDLFDQTVPTQVLQKNPYKLINRRCKGAIIDNMYNNVTMSDSKV